MSKGVAELLYDNEGLGKSFLFSKLILDAQKSGYLATLKAVVVELKNDSKLFGLLEELLKAADRDDKKVDILKQPNVDDLDADLYVLKIELDNLYALKHFPAQFKISLSQSILDEHGQFALLAEKAKIQASALSKFFNSKKLVRAEFLQSIKKCMKTKTIKLVITKVDIESKFSELNTKTVHETLSKFSTSFLAVTKELFDNQSLIEKY